MSKKNWMKIHTYLSLFFLPAALLYLFTGALYIFGLNQNAGAKMAEFAINGEIEKGKEKEIIINTLEINNQKIPSDTNLKVAKGTPYIGNIAYEASLVKNKNGESIVRVNERGIYGILVLMHKSKGAKHEILGLKLSTFDFVALGFALSLMIFYLSGLIVTSFCKKNRKNALAFFGAGFIITALCVWTSI